MDFIHCQNISNCNLSDTRMCETLLGETERRMDGRIDAEEGESEKVRERGERERKIGEKTERQRKTERDGGGKKSDAERETGGEIMRDKREKARERERKRNRKIAPWSSR